MYVLCTNILTCNKTMNTTYLYRQKYISLVVLLIIRNIICKSFTMLEEPYILHKKNKAFFVPPNVQKHLTKDNVSYNLWGNSSER